MSDHQEAARMRALVRYELLDTGPESLFDDIAKLASAIAGTPIALMSLIDSERQWFKAKVGVEVSETPRDIAFCAHAIQGVEPFVVPDALNDARFRDNPLVRGQGVRFYAGFPVRSSDGHALGTLCVIDRKPRELSAETLDLLSKLARQLEAQIEIRSRLMAIERSAKSEAAIDVVHRSEQMTSLIVHDLKSPLNAIGITTSYLRSQALQGRVDDDALQDIESAVVSLQNMVMDLLDIGGAPNGLTVRRSRFDLNEMLAEMRRAFGRVASTRDLSLTMSDCASPAIVLADQNLIRRMLQNLIDNAIKYTPPHGTIRVSITLGPAGIEARVVDSGHGVPDIFKTQIFDAYAQLSQTADSHTASSRGLGLAFCKLAAEAQGGRTWVEDNPAGGSCFCFALPIALND